MKFNRYPKSDFHWSSRREKALVRSREKLINKLPLFKEQFDNELCSVDQQRQKRQEAYYINQTDRRNYEAKTWKKARKVLRTLPKGHQETILKIWNNNKWLPKNSVYFADFIYEWCCGKRPRKFEVEKYNLHNINYGYSLIGDGTLTSINDLRNSPESPQLSLLTD